MAVTPVRKPNTLDYVGDVIGGVGDLIESQQELRNVTNQFQHPESGIVMGGGDMVMIRHSLYETSHIPLSAFIRALPDYKKALRKTSTDYLAATLIEARESGASGTLLDAASKKIKHDIFGETEQQVSLKALEQVIPFIRISEALALTGVILQIKPKTKPSTIRRVLSEAYPTQLNDNHIDMVVHNLFPKAKIKNYHEMMDEIQTQALNAQAKITSESNLEAGLGIVFGIVVSIFVIICIIVFIGFAVTR